MNNTPAEMLWVETASHRYPILFGTHCLRALDALAAPYLPPRGSSCFILSDRAVEAHYGADVYEAMLRTGRRVERFHVEPGEGSKSFASFERLCNEMLAARPDRHTLLVALGGGVVGDLCGFIASVLLRGVPFIQIPTTLLAQVDSSVGGKTAINCAAGKNLIGSFYQPRAVFMDMATLSTLPRREVLAGYAEVLKYGLLGDAAFYEHLLMHGAQALNEGGIALAGIIRHCCAMKAAIVAEDETEQGRRALLNLGHTFGHAIEKEAGYGASVLHGEAVALGCLMALRLSQYLHPGSVSDDEIGQLEQHYHDVGLPTRLSALQYGEHWDAPTLTSHCYGDKKATGGTLNFVTLERIGAARLDHDVSPQHITNIFSEFI